MSDRVGTSDPGTPLLSDRSRIRPPTVVVIISDTELKRRPVSWNLVAIAGRIGRYLLRDWSALIPNTHGVTGDVGPWNCQDKAMA